MDKTISDHFKGEAFDDIEDCLRNQVLSPIEKNVMIACIIRKVKRKVGDQ